MTDDTTSLTPYNVTCRTIDCGNEGHTIAITAGAENPDVMCGACNQPITDIQPL